MAVDLTMPKEVLAFQGASKVMYFKEHGTDNAGMRLPFQTTHNLDLSRDSDTTATKDGSVPTDAPLEPELEVEAISSNHPIYKLFEASLYDGVRLDAWEINFADKNEEGKFSAVYLECKVNEISVDNDADDASSSDVTFSVFPTPQRGYTNVPSSEQKSVSYAFHELADKLATPGK